MAFSALPDYQALFSATFDKAAIGIAHVALDGSWLRVNPRLCAIMGYSPDEFMGKTFQDMTYPDDLERDLHLLRQTLSGQIHRYQMEKRYVRKNGEIIWARLNVALVRDAAGQPDFFVSVVESMQAKKANPNMLNLSLNELHEMFEHFEQGIISANLSGDLLSWNPAARALHGFSPDEKLDFNLTEMLSRMELRSMSGHVLSLSDWPLMRILCGETLRGTELEFCRKDIAFRRALRYRGSLVLDASGEAVLALLTMADANSPDHWSI